MRVWRNSTLPCWVRISPHVINGGAAHLWRRWQSSTSTSCKQNQQTRFPVVMVHGFRLTTPSEDVTDIWYPLDTLADALGKRGHPILRFNYSPRDETIDVHATRLAEFMSEAVLPSKADQGDGAQSTPTIGIVTHSFGGVVARAALNSNAWHLGAGSRATSIRCVLFAPPNRGSSLARTIMPERWDQHLKGWDTARMALDMLSKTVLGEKAGVQLAQLQHTTTREEFGCFPSSAEVLVVAGDCGEINPLLDGSSDGVVTVAETYLSTPHTRMCVSAPHNIVCKHPSAVRAAIDFVSNGNAAVEPLLLQFHPGYLSQ